MSHVTIGEAIREVVTECVTKQKEFRALGAGDRTQVRRWLLDDEDRSDELMGILFGQRKRAVFVARAGKEII